MRERIARRCGYGFGDELRGGRVEVLRRLRLHGRLAPLFFLMRRCYFRLCCTTELGDVERAMKKFSCLHFLLDVLHEVEKGE